MHLRQNSITFFCKNFEAIWLKCLKSIWPTHVSPETVPRTYSHRKQSPKHQFYQPQQHLTKPVSLVEGCDFSRRVELTDSLPNHHKKKRNISPCQLLPLAPRPKSPNLLLSFFPYCPPWCSFRSSSSSLALWRLITVAALSQDIAIIFHRQINLTLSNSSFFLALLSNSTVLPWSSHRKYRILCRNLLWAELSNKTIQMALCWSMRPHNALLIDGLLFF